MEVRWRVKRIVVMMAGKKDGRDMPAPVPRHRGGVTEEEAGAKARSKQKPNKKRRILIRERIRKDLTRRTEEERIRGDKDREDREKRARRNREKKVKRRIREKAKKQTKKNVADMVNEGMAVD